MNRSIRLFIQWSLVAFLITFITAGPTSAGWLRNRLRSHCCQPPQKQCHVDAAPAMSCESSTASCCPSVSCCPSASHSATITIAPPMNCSCGVPVQETAVASSDCGCTSPPHLNSPAISSPVIGEMSDSMPLEYAPSTDPFVPGQPFEAGVVIESTPLDSAPMSVPADEQPFESDVIDSAPIEAAPIASASDNENPPAMADEKNPDPPTEVETTDEPEADNAADDLFAAPADAPANDASEEEAANDLFGSDQPMNENPADDAGTDDLFGATAEEPVANDPPLAAEESATDATADEKTMDNLFDSSDAPTPADDAAPAEEAVDDLFGSPTEGAPADDAASGDESQDTAPADDSAIDDLFGSANDANGVPATDITTDGPENTITEPAKKMEDALDSDANGIDDLFGTPEDDQADSEVDDLFGFNEIQEMPAPREQKSMEQKPGSVRVVSNTLANQTTLDQTHQRTWIDNTGRFHTEGRLVEIHADYIRILKTNGRLCTVPSSRLCDADAAYVGALRAKIRATQIAMLTSK